MTGYPAAPPAFAPPRRRRSRWLTVGLPVGIVLLLGGCGAVVTLFVTTVGRDIKPAQQAASQYAQALVDQRFTQAQQMLCTRDQASISAAALADHYQQPKLTAYRLTSVVVRVSKGTETAQVGVRFTTADGLHNSTELPLVQENGTWRPCP